MAVSDRSRALLDKVADSKLGQTVIVPKLVEPLASWHNDRNGDDDGPQGEGTTLDVRAGEPTIDLHGRHDLDGSGGPEAVSSTDQSSTDQPAGDPNATDDVPPSDPDYHVPATRLARLKELRLRVADRIKDHNLPVISAGVAFWGLLSIPAMLISTLSIYGMVADPAEVEQQINDGMSGLPESARDLIAGQLESVAGSSGAGLAIGAIIGVLAALWTVSGAVSKVIATLNTIWRVRETRFFLLIRGIALGLTVGAIVFFVATAFVLAVVPAILDNIGLGSAVRWLLNLARVPVLLLGMAAGLGVLYWAGPNRTGDRYRLASPGALTATVLWLVLSFAFSVYATFFSSYNETYGALGGVVIVLMWLYITAFVVFIGAEVDAALEDRAAGIPPPEKPEKKNPLAKLRRR